jgi:hypothetical protein
MVAPEGICCGKAGLNDRFPGGRIAVAHQALVLEGLQRPGSVIAYARVSTPTSAHHQGHPEEQKALPAICYIRHTID